MGEIIPKNKELTYIKTFYGFTATNKNSEYYNNYEYYEKLIQVIKKYPPFPDTSITTINKKVYNRYYLVKYEEFFNNKNKLISKKLHMIEEIKDCKNLLECSKYNSIYKRNIKALLTYSIINQSFQDVEYLISNGAKINAHKCLGFIFACRYGYYKIVEYLISHGVNVSIKDYEGFRLALLNSHMDIVDLLIDKVDVNACNGFSLIYACAYGHIDKVKLLLSHGANLDIHNDRAIEYARRYNHHEIVEYLLKI